MEKLIRTVGALNGARSVPATFHVTVVVPLPVSGAGPAGPVTANGALPPP